MTSFDLYQAIGQADDRFLAASERCKPSVRFLASVASAAACILLAAVILLTHFNLSPTNDTVSCDGAPSVTVGGITYLVSPHNVSSVTCPENFECAGELADGEFAGHKYYVNPRMPLWVYVYQRTNATGSDGEYIYQYVRYVREDIRGKNLVMFDGQLYISMYSLSSNYGDENSIRIRQKYGCQIEGEAPDGFESAGYTDFSGYDLVPDKNFGSNCHTAPAEIYADFNDRSIIMISSCWYTDAQWEDGETLHKGWDVYVLWQQ